MKPKLLDKIKATKRWPLTFWNFIGRHHIFIFLPFFYLYLAVTMLYGGISNADTHVQLTGGIILIVALLSFFFISKRIRQNYTFEEYTYPNVPKTYLITSLKSIGFKNVKYHESGYIQCAAAVSGFSWGETVTIVFNDVSLLINSRPNNQPITIFEDRRNIRKIISVLNGYSNSGEVVQ